MFSLSHHLPLHGWSSNFLLTITHNQNVSILDGKHSSTKVARCNTSLASTVQWYSNKLLLPQSPPCVFLPVILSTKKIASPSHISLPGTLCGICCNYLSHMMLLRWLLVHIILEIKGLSSNLFFDLITFLWKISNI